MLSGFLIKVLKDFCFKYNILHRPRKRDVGRKPLPRLAGIGIFLSFMVVSLVYFLFIHKGLQFSRASLYGLDRHLLGIWIGGTVVTLSMVVDDLIGLKAWQKILIQIFAALIVIASGIGINTISNPFGVSLNLNSIYIPILKVNGIVYHFSLLSDILTLVWVVGMMNVINFVDGVDGLAGGLSFIAAMTLFFLSRSIGVSQDATALMSVILAGSVLGFLFWNFPPAKIFMGDSGSMFLGFILGVLPLISGGKLATVFLVLGFPIVDGFFVASSRLIRGSNPFTTPDKTHLHHRFLKAGFSQRQAILSLYLIAIAFGWVALRSTTELKLAASLVLVLALIVIILILKYLEKRKHNYGI